MPAQKNETSRKRGEVFAASVNGTQEAANWQELDSSDHVPEPDFVALSKEFGECTREMKRAYRDGFNHTFRPVDRACLMWWASLGNAARRDVMYHAETTDIAKAWAWHKWIQIQDAR